MKCKSVTNRKEETPAKSEPGTGTPRNSARENSSSQNYTLTQSGIPGTSARQSTATIMEVEKLQETHPMSALMNALTTASSLEHVFDIPSVILSLEDIAIGT